MKRQLSIIGVLIAIVGLVVGMTGASATVPGNNQLVSQDSSSTYANGPSTLTTAFYRGGSANRISGNGRYIAFTSSATNLVAGDTNGKADVFVRDTVTNTTQRVSLDNNGAEYSLNSFDSSISHDGRYVLFFLDVSTGVYYIRDRVANTTALVHNTSCTDIQGASMSADGRYVTFKCKGALISGFSGGGIGQIYIRDMHIASNIAGAHKAISVDSSGTAAKIGLSVTNQSGGMSCDGGVVSFTSNATNLPNNSSGKNNLFVAHVGWSGSELTNATYNRTGISSVGWRSLVSCDGNVILYDHNGKMYQYNRLTQSHTEVGLSTSGASVGGWPASMSSDGRFVAFTSHSSGVDPTHTDTGAGPDWDVYVRDVKDSTTHLVTFVPAGNRAGQTPDYDSGISISPDGSKVAFTYNTPSTSNPIYELISGTNTGTITSQKDVYISETGF